MKKFLLALVVISLIIFFLILKLNNNENYANKPVLADGMIPVYYDNDAKVWKKADINNKSNNWYNYETKKWANAIMVNKEAKDLHLSKSRKYYLDAKVDTVIFYKDILAFYVWIPKYSYKLFNTSYQKIEPQIIDIKFENINTTSDGTCNNKYKEKTNGCYYTHPSFTFGNDKLSGIWVSKFETTGITEEPTILPNSIALTNQSIAEQFLTAKKFESETYVEAESLDQIDIHMMKNIEWGAVAYLSNSKYGRCSSTTCEEIYQNNSMGITGRSGGNVAGKIKDMKEQYQINEEEKTVYGYYTYDDRIVNYDGTVGIYINNNLGTKSSTTGNIYGIYDMSGGSNEYTMSTLLYKDGSIISGLNETKNSGFNGILINDGNITNKTDGYSLPESKYYDLYTYNDKNNTFNRSILGDATGETRNWYNDKECLVTETLPWTKRGCSSVGEEKSGLFYFCSNEGLAQSHISFRTVIAVK